MLILKCSPFQTDYFYLLNCCTLHEWRLSTGSVVERLSEGLLCSRSFPRWSPREYLQGMPCATDMVCRAHGRTKTPPALTGAEHPLSSSGQRREKSICSCRAGIKGMEGLRLASWSLLGALLPPCSPPARIPGALMTRTQTQSPVPLLGVAGCFVQCSKSQEPPQLYLTFPSRPPGESTPLAPSGGMVHALPALG